MSFKGFQLIATALVLVITSFSLSCSGFEPQQTEEQALQSLRQMMKEGKMPNESYVQQIESRFSNTKTGALCKLIRANIRLANSDFNGAAEILNSNLFAQKQPSLITLCGCGGKHFCKRDDSAKHKPCWKN